MATLVPLALARLAAVALRVFFYERARLVQGDSAEGFGWGFLQLSLRFLDGQIALSNTSHHRYPWSEIYRLFFMGSCGILYYMAAVVCGVFTAKLASNSAMLSNSPQCGMYLPAAMLAPSGVPLDWHTSVLPYAYEAELDSANWAKNCYGDSDSKDGCNFFVQPQIPYMVVENASCPFDNEMCYYGANSGIRFYTPPISADSLGINAPRTFEIQRSTECAPLNRNETFIQATKNGSSITFRYYYGESWTWGNASHLTMSDGKLINAATYELVALPSGIPTYWNPLPSLQPPPNAMTTLLFILGGKLYHEEARSDPVFPADRVRYMPSDVLGGVKPYWINSLGHATVLGCVDKTEWRDPYYGEDWSQHLVKLQKRPSDPKVRAAAWLLYYSIQNSNIYYSLDARSAGALDAQKRIAKFYLSLPLAEEQWKAEAKQLFETSLARIQLNVKAIARGELAKYPGLAKVGALTMTDGDPVDICDGTYLFNGNGYTNINFVPWLLVLVFCCMVIVFAVPFNGDHPDDLKFFGGYCYKIARVAGEMFGKFVLKPFINDTKDVLVALYGAFLKLAGSIRRHMRNWH
ncbi:hypothetical protein MMC32_001925 [Xylographa parallela]|nr:hypothetical protein [Xylographa parallela]